MKKSLLLYAALFGLLLELGAFPVETIAEKFFSTIPPYRAGFVFYYYFCN